MTAVAPRAIDRPNRRPPYRRPRGAAAPRPRDVGLLGILGFLGYLTAPMTGALGRAVLGFRLTDALLLAALVAAGLAPRPPGTRLFSVDRRTRNVLIGIGLMVAGLLIGEVSRGAATDELRVLVGRGAAAALPIFVMVTPRITDRTRRFVAGGLVIGSVVSVLLGATAERLPSGRAAGLASHQNQLAMTCVVAFALLPVVFRGRGPGLLGRIVVGAILLQGLLISGSRSGLIALGVVLLLWMWTWTRRGRGRLPLLLVALCLALLGAGMSGVEVESGTASDLGRPIGREDTSVSDQERAELLDAAISDIDVDTLVHGEGFVLERSPHNVFVEVLVAGGLVAFAGLLLVAGTVGLVVIRSGPSRDVAVFSAIAFMGFLAAVFFNNALWAPFAWCTVALIAHRAPGTQGRRRSNPSI